MLYEIRHTPTKGLGLFAKTAIPRGTRILAERPLLALRKGQGQESRDVLTRAGMLDRIGRERVLGLSDWGGGWVERGWRWGVVLKWCIGQRFIGRWGGDVEKGFLGGRRGRGGLMREMREGERILRVFRSNCFDLGGLGKGSELGSTFTGSTRWTTTSTFTSTTSSTPATNLLNTPSPLLTSSLTPLSSAPSLTPLPHTLHPSTATTPSPSPSSSPSTQTSQPAQSTPSIPLTSSLAPPYTLALFPTISRTNHSCHPNTQANYHPTFSSLTLHATHTIPANAEITINYLPEHAQIRSTRVEKLERGYGFTCVCPACDGVSEVGVRGEEGRRAARKRIRMMSEEQNSGSDEGGAASYSADGTREDTFTPPPSPPSTSSTSPPVSATTTPPNPAEEKALLQSLISTLESSGIRGREVATMYYTLARHELAQGRNDEAVKAAERGLVLDRECLGEDHPVYGEMCGFVEGVRRG